MASYPKYNIVIVVASNGTTTATLYTTEIDARNAYYTAVGVSGQSAALYLQPQPVNSYIPSKVSGTAVDAYGVSHTLPLAN